jgi:hypothetical protein
MARFAYSEDHFVLLEPGQPERILSAEDLRAHLMPLLASHPEALTPDLTKLNTPQAQVQALVDSTCELDLGPGKSLQWYAVRLEN